MVMVVLDQVGSDFWRRWNSRRDVYSRCLEGVKFDQAWQEFLPYYLAATGVEKIIIFPLLLLPKVASWQTPPRSTARNTSAGRVLSVKIVWGIHQIELLRSSLSRSGWTWPLGLTEAKSGLVVWKAFEPFHPGQMNKVLGLYMQPPVFRSKSLLVGQDLPGIVMWSYPGSGASIFEEAWDGSPGLKEAMDHLLLKKPLLNPGLWKFLPHLQHPPFNQFVVSEGRKMDCLDTFQSAFKCIYRLNEIGLAAFIDPLLQNWVGHPNWLSLISQWPSVPLVTGPQDGVESGGPGIGPEEAEEPPSW